MTTACAFQLITEQEASLPDDLALTRRGGPTRGPEVVFVSPSNSGALVKSPLNVKIRFRAHGGAAIDRESIVVTYKKLPPVDMTQRLIPYIRQDGIELDAAEIPPGTHRLRIDVKDADGRLGTGTLVINVGK
jgi:hypothetical protein